MGSRGCEALWEMGRVALCLPRLSDAAPTENDSILSICSTHIPHPQCTQTWHTDTQNSEHGQRWSGGYAQPTHALLHYRSCTELLWEHVNVDRRKESDPLSPMRQNYRGMWRTDEDPQEEELACTDNQAFFCASLLHSDQRGGGGQAGWNI